MEDYQLNKRIFQSVMLFVLLQHNTFAQLKIVTDSPKYSFPINQDMYLKINTVNGGDGQFSFFSDPRISDKVLKKGTMSLFTKRDTVIFFQQKEPSVVFFRAQIGGTIDTKVLTFDPLSIQPSASEPSDFDAFWIKQKEALKAIPMNPVLKPISDLPNGSKQFILQLDGVDGRKVYGYLSIPKGTGKFPAVLSLPAFGDGTFPSDGLVNGDFTEKANAISLIINVHNAPPNEIDPKAYKPDVFSDANKIYARYMVLAGLRALDYLTSRADFNGSLGVCGLSQGGGLSIMLAGLDNRVSALMVDNPAFCNHHAWRVGKSSGFPQYLKNATAQSLDTIAVGNAVKYYDAAYFLKRYRNPAMILTGYLDDVTPTESVFSAASQHRGQLTVCHLLKMGHNYPWMEYWEGRNAFFGQHLKDFTNFSTFKRTYSMTNPNIPERQAEVITTEIGKSTPLFTTININGVLDNSLKVKWSKVEGEGEVRFDKPTEKTTNATFSRSGTYIIRVQADDDYLLNEEDAKYFTIVNHITIKVNENQNNPQTTNIEAEKISVFPNPSVFEVTVRWNLDNITQLDVFDTVGKLVYSEDVSTKKQKTVLETEDWLSGMYIIQLTTNKNKSFNKKYFKVN
jgi:cephalosporin-C deacetylase-like acetyl esterase